MPTQIGEIKLYSIKELSEAFKITKETLRNYLASGRLKGRKLGTRWFVTEDNLRKYFMNIHEPKKRKITLQGIAENSMVTDKDIEDIKHIWK